MSSHRDREGSDSFAEILQRTRQNINRISQKYGAEASVSLPPPPLDRSLWKKSNSNNCRNKEQGASYPSYSSATKEAQVYFPRKEKENFENDFRAGNMMSEDAEHWQRSSFSDMSPQRYNQQRHREADQEDPSFSNEQHHNLSSNQMNDIYRRLEMLETDENRKDEQNKRLVERVSSLEKVVEGLSHKVDELTTENKEQRRELSKLSGQMNSHNTSLEILQHDVESRRSTVAKLDSWVRQGEIWRNELDSQISEIQAHMKHSNRQNNEQKDSLAECVTKSDLESFRDRVHISTQQAVAASLSAWHDKVELSVRQLERQVAALRLGGTLSTRDGTDGESPDQGLGLLLNDEEVKKALMTQQPSELLLKGIVSSEMRHVETDLEQKLQLHMTAAVRAHLVDSIKELKDDLKQYVARSLSQALEEEGLAAPPKAHQRISSSGENEQPTSNTLSKLSSFRQEKERELSYLSDRVDDLSAALIAIQESQGASEKNSSLEIRGLERRIEECISMSSAYVTSVQNRASEMDSKLKDSEGEQRKRHEDLRSELLNRLVEVSQTSSSDRVELEKRLVLTEKMVGSVVERVDMSKSIFEGLFNSSPDIKRFQTTSVKLEGLMVEFNSLRSDLRSLEKSTASLEATASNKDHVAEIKERLTHVEPMIKRVEEFASAQQDIQSEMSHWKSGMNETKASLESLRVDSKSNAEVVSGIEQSIKSLSRQLESLEQSQEKSFQQRINYCDEQRKSDVSALRSALQHQEKELKSLASMSSKLSGSTESLKENLDNVKESLREVNRKASEESSQSVKQQNSLEAMHRQLSEVKDSILKLQNVTSKLELSRDMLQGEHRESRNELHLTSQKVDLLESRVQELRFSGSRSTSTSKVFENEIRSPSDLHTTPTVPQKNTKKSFVEDRASERKSSSDTSASMANKSDEMVRSVERSEKDCNINDTNDSSSLQSSSVRNDKQQQKMIDESGDTRTTDGVRLAGDDSADVVNSFDFDSSFDDAIPSLPSSPAKREDEKAPQSPLVSSTQDNRDQSSDSESDDGTANHSDDHDNDGLEGKHERSVTDGRVSGGGEGEDDNLVNSFDLDSSFDDTIPSLPSSPAKDDTKQQQQEMSVVGSMQDQQPDSSDSDESQDSHDAGEGDKNNEDGSIGKVEHKDRTADDDNLISSFHADSSFDDTIPSLPSSPATHKSIVGMQDPRGHDSNQKDDRLSDTLKHSDDHDNDGLEGKHERSITDGRVSGGGEDDNLVNSFDLDSSFDDTIPSLPSSPAKDDTKKQQQQETSVVGSMQDQQPDSSDSDESQDSHDGDEKVDHKEKGSMRAQHNFDSGDDSSVDVDIPSLPSSPSSAANRDKTKTSASGDDHDDRGNESGDGLEGKHERSVTDSRVGGEGEDDNLVNSFDLDSSFDDTIPSLPSSPAKDDTKKQQQQETSVVGRMQDQQPDCRGDHDKDDNNSDKDGKVETKPDQGANLSLSLDLSDIGAGETASVEDYIDLAAERRRREVALKGESEKSQGVVKSSEDSSITDRHETTPDDDGDNNTDDSNKLKKKKSSNIFSFSALDDSTNMSSEDDASNEDTTDKIEEKGSSSEVPQRSLLSPKKDEAKEPAKLSFRDKLRQRQEALRMQKLAASQDKDQSSTHDSTSSSSDSESSSDSPQKPSKSNDIDTSSKSSDDDNSSGGIDNKPSARDVASKFGTKKFGSSDEDDDDEVVKKDNEGEDMVMSFDDDFDSSFDN